MLQLTVEPTGDGLKLVGELDASNVGVLQRALAPRMRTGGDVVLDVAELRFLDSVGLRAIIRSAMALEDRGALVVRNPTYLVERILDETGVVSNTANLRVERT